MRCNHERMRPARLGFSIARDTQATLPRRARGQTQSLGERGRRVLEQRKLKVLRHRWELLRDNERRPRDAGRRDRRPTRGQAITVSMREHGDRAFMVGPKLLVELLVQSRRVGEGDDEKKRPNDSQRIEATRFGTFAPKKLPAHESELASKCTLRKREISRCRDRAARGKKKPYPPATRCWHSA